MWIKNLYLKKTYVSYVSQTMYHSVYKVALPQWTLINGIIQTFSKYLIKNRNPQLLVSKAIHSAKENVVQKAQLEQNCSSFTFRTHTCGELRPKHEGQRVALCGWLQFFRLSKFLLVRDSYGLTQCVVSKNIKLSELPLETVIKIEGRVSLRPIDMINRNMTTGEIEVLVDNLEILNTVDKLPFNLRNYQKPKEQLRLQHRYIDLRFPEMQTNLRQRSHMLHSMRKYLVENHGFVEVETPTLFCRTPGGAREFVVPTRHSGLFYSLVQSPQQFKQMLMSGGIDRYFQIARCYRDETTRPDRQPEFTQLDIELSFTTLDGVLMMIEALLYNTFIKPLPKPPFKRMTYKAALENYGTDKPNLTYELKLRRLSHLFPEEEHNVSFGAYALPYPRDSGKLASKYKEKIRDLMKKYNTRIILNENIMKELGTDIFSKVQDVIGETNFAIIALGDNENSCLCLGEVREMVALLLESKNILNIDTNIEPLWVIDFPLFVKGENGLETCHHPFTAPHPEDIHLLDTDPLKVRSLAYDIVMNGNEVGGGSVRVHDVKLQERILRMLDIDPQKLQHFLDALRCGCPPHGGIALGIDRLVTLACNAESIREVIAFPKSHDGRDPLSGAPNIITEEDKKYYHISTIT